ncbi:MAG TPA: HD domain-containing phosphohydrolase [Acidobacteriota bacterium]|nr:HD domain-containing phosphohydrolase [Acidobacteriota bacterium]
MSDNVAPSSDLRQELEVMKRERQSHLRRLKELNNIGISLSTEKDPVKLLNMILQKSRELTSADAGSLYLVEGDEEIGRRLRFKILQNDSVEMHYEEFIMAITKTSIAGYVAITGKALTLPDVYQISSDSEFRFNRHVDEATGYRSTSMLAVPMKNPKGEILGIIQLINRKRDTSAKLTRENFHEFVEPFSENDEEIISSLASQAAVALQNSILMKSIERLFEGFVTAAVTAIESRDPTTSGHSFRVADLTVGLAELVDRVDLGKFAEVRFTGEQIQELKYAALLHDFGKVGVRENVLVKAKKLYPLQMDLIRQRFEYLKAAWEAEYYKSKLNLLMTEGLENYRVETEDLEKQFRARIESLEDYWNFIHASNEPTVLPQGNFEKLLRIASDVHLVPPGSVKPLLEPEEVQLLSIRKGSLNDRERIEIESHVTHTFLFLSKIPWTSELKRIPRIAYGHHEKLDGSGYPNRLKAEDIPVQTRIMTISDIYDALTASDRPYKRAVQPERALDIISEEVKKSQLDADLFEIFTEGKVYLRTAGQS